MLIPTPTNTEEDVRVFLRYYLREQKEVGVRKAIILSGQIHKLLMLENKLPMVESAMYSLVQAGDRIIQKGSGKAGPGVVIEYDLEKY